MGNEEKKCGETAFLHTEEEVKGTLAVEQSLVVSYKEKWITSWSRKFTLKYTGTIHKCLHYPKSGNNQNIQQMIVQANNDMLDM